MEDIYEKKIVKCPSCGKEKQIIKYKGIITEGFLCQRCGMGNEKLEED